MSAHHDPSSPLPHCDHACCSCHGISRRRFLAGAAAVGLGALAWRAVEAPAFGADDLGDYIELSSLRPRPAVTIASCTVRIPPPYWLGWPGTSYDLEGRYKGYAAKFAQMGKKLGVTVNEAEKPLESDQAVEAYAQKLAAEKPDAVLVSIQHMGVWHWADRISKAGVPTIIFSPVGTSFTGHVGEISRRPGVHVVSSLEMSGIEQALRMVRAKAQLAATRLLIVAGEERRETVLERLGTKIRYIPRRTLHEMFVRMPETAEARQVAARMRGGARKVVEPTEQDVLNAARSYMTAKRLCRDEQANGLSTDCLGMVGSKLVPTPPCMAATLFQDGGVTYGCEADLWAAMGLTLTSYLFDRPGFMNDPVAETVKNLLIVAHCSCGTRLSGFDQPQAGYALRSHSESNIGVSLQVYWQPGQPVTLLSVQGTDTLLVDTGVVVGNVNTPPAGGCRTSVEVKMDHVADCRDVMGFHQVVSYGNHQREIEAFAQMYGMKVVHSPERSAP